MERKWSSLSPKNDDWVKGKPIGHGTFGTVHLAMDKSNGSLFVAKSAKSEHGMRSLKNEATILEKLESPHIVKGLGKDIFEGVNGERDFNLLMEYLPGGSLFDVAEKFGGMLDERVIRLYTREILLGLNYLHDNGIVHGDLKCKNVLLDAFGAVKLADFGCARNVYGLKNYGCSNISSTNNVSGTPLWMAPEILRNGELEYASDIWSLGCTIIEMATGRPPWDGVDTNPTTILMKIACSDETPILPSNISSVGIDFLDKCLRRDPKKRWTTKELLNHPFVSQSKQHLGKGDRSPSSVFDIEMCEEMYDSDESIASDKLKDRIASLANFCEIDNNFLWSDNDWITVR